MSIRDRRNKGDLTVERVRELFHYDPLTGIFTRLIRAGSAMAGTIAGTQRPDSRWLLSVDGPLYLRSRLAWFYVHGEWPTPDIDHKNLDYSDDRLDNLRVATRSQNVSHRGKWGGISKYIGVSKDHGRWTAEVQAKGKRVRLRYFASEEEAARARDFFAREIHGDFAVMNFLDGA